MSFPKYPDWFSLGIVRNIETRVVIPQQTKYPTRTISQLDNITLLSVLEEIKDKRS